MPSSMCDDWLAYRLNRKIKSGGPAFPAIHGSKRSLPLLLAEHRIVRIASLAASVSALFLSLTDVNWFGFRDIERPFAVVHIELFWGDLFAFLFQIVVDSFNIHRLNKVWDAGRVMLPKVGGELLVQFAFPVQTFAAGNRSVFGADDILAWDTAECRIHREAARELFAKCEAASP